MDTSSLTAGRLYAGSDEHARRVDANDADVAPPRAETAADLRRPGRLRRWGTRTLAGVGALALVGVGVGAVADFRDFDRTSGGYEAPYTGWTGTPVDWQAGITTETGFIKPGHVLDVHLDCTSGMVSFGTFGTGLTVDWRTVSPRAIAVHKPREACRAQGFTPQF
ncbi:MAG: hypothetical protein ACRCXL_00395 [Dermatophilaceae bacterium]